MMGLPTVTGNAVVDAMFYGGIAFLALLFVGPFVWHAVDRYRFRNEHDEADKTIAAARFAADADMSKTAPSERRQSPFAPKAGAR